MKERERAVVTGLVVLMLIVWLGFVFHQSPRFAGSFWGGMLGLSGAVLMLVPLAYLIVKRIKWLKPRVTKYVSMRTLLAWHIYAGILGPILVLLHTGHKFNSLLGMTLTTMTLIVVISGFIGRYLMNRFSTEIREKKSLLKKLQFEYQQVADQLVGAPQVGTVLLPFRGILGQLTASFFIRDFPDDATGPVNVTVASPYTMLRLSESIADIEYAIKTHETFKKWFGKWLKFHIIVSVILYLLMALHIWAAIHFGIRWITPFYSSTSYYSSTLETGTKSQLRSFENSPQRQNSLAAVEKFSLHFGKIFKQHWRESVVIHGIRTTVFDYAGIAKEIGNPESNYSQAIQALQQVDPEYLGGGNLEKAFWINVYNFGAMKMASEKYPVTSITDPKISDGNPWKKKEIRIGNGQYSLVQVEKEILLKKFDDPRIVFAVSCAAVSCPDRTDEIFSAEKIDQQLEDIVKGLLSNSTKGLAIGKQQKTIMLTWILKADKRLFGDGSDDGLIDFARYYTTDENRNWIDANRGDIKLEFFKHDWGLNDIALADKEN
ncbi:MAG: DUF547 domain-containing protein [Planctomycetaceae bacterium]|nr:DUF547 domain-containing protein [Planctomycetaceae bacterium]